MRSLVVILAVVASAHGLEAYGPIEVSKCCVEGKSIQMVDGYLSCDSSDQAWHPVFHLRGWFSVIKTRLPPENWTFVDGLACNQSYVLDTREDHEDAFYLLTDGTLYVPKFSDSYTTDEYCVDLEVLNGTQPHEVAYMCPTDPSHFEQTASEVRFQLYVVPALLILSLVCLILTFVVHSVVVPKKHLHTATLLNYVSALFLGFFGMVVIRLVPADIYMHHTSLCKAIGILTHFFFLASFFWLCVMSFDIWRTISNVMSRGKHLFKMFVAFGWIAPVVISVVTLVMDFSPGVPPFLIKPRFAYRSCWFVDSRSSMAYFLIPVAILLGINAVLFVLTIVQVAKSRSESLDAGSQKTKRKVRTHHIKRLKLCLVLFVAMGLNWFGELLWHLVTMRGSRNSWYFFVVSDVVNSSQGILVMLIFVLNPATRRLVAKRISSWLQQGRQQEEDNDGQSQDTTSSCSNQGTDPRNTFPMQDKVTTRL